MGFSHCTFQPALCANFIKNYVQVSLLMSIVSMQAWFTTAITVSKVYYNIIQRERELTTIFA